MKNIFCDMLWDYDSTMEMTDDKIIDMLTDWFHDKRIYNEFRLER